MECTGLTTVTIPSGVKVMHSTFFECTGLKSVTLSEGLVELSGAFRGCTNLTEIVVPNSVTEIWGAFENCTSLKHITLGNNLSVISGFNGCTSLEEIIIPESVNTIWMGTFEGCTSLKSITIPEAVNNIEEGTFSGCTSLEEVHLPEHVGLGMRAFMGCSALKSIRLPKNLRVIETDIFNGCTSLTQIEIPDKVIQICFRAFQGCSGLKTVILHCSNNPNIAQQPPYYPYPYYEDKSFEGCTGITDVWCYSEEVPRHPLSDSWGQPFTNSYIQYATLHVPGKSLDAYMQNSGWNGFGSIVPIETERCATPSMILDGGKLLFECATKGAEFVSEITCGDQKLSVDDVLPLDGTYHVSVYAKALGYLNSEVVNGTICWKNNEPVLEITTNNQKSVEL
jgi:hypothetical protein